MGDISLSFLSSASAFLRASAGILASLDLLVDLFEVRAVLALAEFFLDGLDLLVEIEVALVLLHLALHAAADLLVHVQDVDFAVKLLEQILKARLHIREVQHHLLVLQLERQVGRNGVGQAAGIVDAGDRRQDLGWDLLVELDVLVKLLHHRTAQCLDFTRFGFSSAWCSMGVTVALKWVSASSMDWTRARAAGLRPAP
jgi:hypothetical protein